MTALDEFEPIFGKAQAHLESGASHTPHPFLFLVRTLGPDRLQLYVTDFHAHTWHAEMSTAALEDLKDDVGIGGSWAEFVRYVRAGFASDHVKVLLTRREGGGLATLVSQKVEGAPKLRFALVEVEESAAGDVMASVAGEMFGAFRAQAVCLSSECARAAQMATAYVQAKERADKLQEKLDALSFTKKKSRFRPTLSVDDPSLAQPLATQSLAASQFAAPSVFEDLGTQGVKAAGSSGQMDPPKGKPAAAKVGLAGPRLRAAPIGRRSKRRAPADSDDDN